FAGAAYSPILRLCERQDDDIEPNFHQFLLLSLVWLCFAITCAMALRANFPLLNDIQTDFTTVQALSRAETLCWLLYKPSQYILHDLRVNKIQQDALIALHDATGSVCIRAACASHALLPR